MTFDNLLLRNEPPVADPELEWYIVNFGSKDDLDGFMGLNLGAASVRVVYAKELSSRPWHLSGTEKRGHALTFDKRLRHDEPGCGRILAGGRQTG